MEKTTFIQNLEAFLTLTKASDSAAVTRPGTYRGTHFYDLGSQYLWAAGNNGDPCLTEKWFYVDTIPGDDHVKLDKCPITGMYEYEIILAP